MQFSANSVNCVVTQHHTEHHTNIIIAGFILLTYSLLIHQKCLDDKLIVFALDMFAALLFLTYIERLHVKKDLLLRT